MKVILAKKKHSKCIAEILFTEWYDSLKEVKERVKSKIHSRECFIAVEKKEIRGIFMYSRDYSHYANYGEDLIVLKEHRRKGVAHELLQKFVEISKKEQPKKQKYALSSTDVTNTASIKMHLKSGFKKLGIIKELHYGKDEIIFGYELR